MGAKIDMTGKKINNLTVLYMSDKRTASGSIKWTCQCDCGNICDIDGTRLRSGKAKSCGCKSKEALNKGRGKNFQDLTGNIYGKIQVLERAEDKEYANGRKVVQWKCKCSCNRITFITSDNLRTGNTQSCGFCNNNSHGNIKIEEILTKYNISFIREKRFETCKDKITLPFDFYVENKYCIEFDGKQHFSSNNTIFDYEDTKKHDKIKNEWCKENNVPLIRIPYTHYKQLKIEDLLLETSQFIMPT